MSNVSTKPFMSMSTEYARLNQASVQVDKPLELSSAADNVSKFLKDSSPGPKENNLTVDKESLEKLFAMFEFAVKAMRSMLAGMGVLPKMPGELDAQSQLKPGPDPKVVADTNGKTKIEPKTDAKTQVKLSSDPKVIADTSVKPKIEPQTDARTQVKPGPDPKVVADTNVKPGIEPLAQAKTPAKPGPDLKVKPDGHTQVNLTPDGKLATKPAMTSLTDTAQNNKLSSEINVIVQVQGCHCPHTGEKIAPQPALTPKVDMQPAPPALVTPKVDAQPQSPAVVNPKVDKQPSLPSPVMPKLDTSPLLQPQVTPATVKKTEPNAPATPVEPTSTTVDPKPEIRPAPDLAAPAPDDLVNDSSSGSRSRFDDHRAARPSLRSRF
ncbi:hypothetical protein [Pseudomonas sp. EL_65y_Pfl1_R83]|uniref:hypothetical protein n=1 Tax=Pseudomonas sp. EL_65y_Pfl1_R83 TaxID=3088697 RepID=UPI0030DCBD9B